MPIPKLEKERNAVFVLSKLPNVHNNLITNVAQLRDTTRTYGTGALIDIQKRQKTTYNYVKDFWEDDGPWFTTVFPDWAAVIPGYLLSWETINAAIVTGLQDHYWDQELNVPVIMDISQVHRNALADIIESELEL